MVKACYDGGVRAFEFTNRGDFDHEVFAEVVKYAAKECPEMAAGAGLEVSTGIGHFLLEGRYYMGLSDFYKNSKRDFFERSAHSFIGIRLSYLIDITK